MDTQFKTRTAGNEKHVPLRDYAAGILYRKYFDSRAVQLLITINFFTNNTSGSVPRDKQMKVHEYMKQLRGKTICLTSTKNGEGMPPEDKVAFEVREANGKLEVVGIADVFVAGTCFDFELTAPRSTFDQIYSGKLQKGFKFLPTRGMKVAAFTKLKGAFGITTNKVNDEMGITLSEVFDLLKDLKNYVPKGEFPVKESEFAGRSLQ